MLTESTCVAITQFSVDDLLDVFTGCSFGMDGSLIYMPPTKSRNKHGFLSREAVNIPKRIQFDEGRQSRSRAANKNCAVQNHCAVRGSRDNSVGIRATIRCRICPHETAGAFLVQQLLFLVRAKYLPQQEEKPAGMIRHLLLPR